MWLVIYIFWKKSEYSLEITKHFYLISPPKFCCRGNHFFCEPTNIFKLLKVSRIWIIKNIFRKYYIFSTSNMQNHALRSDQHECIFLDYQNIQLKNNLGSSWANWILLALYDSNIWSHSSGIFLGSLKCPSDVQTLRLLFQTSANIEQHLFHENGAVQKDLSRQLNW